MKGVASKGLRVGTWMSRKQAILNAPDIATRKELRGRAILAVLQAKPRILSNAVETSFN